MQPLFDYFKFARLLNLQDGRIDLMQVPVNIIPTAIMVDLQKNLIQSSGLEDAYNKIYSVAKTGSYKYNADFMKKQGFKDKRIMLDWQVKIVTFAGWGNLQLSNVDINNDTVVVKYDNSPFPKEYGKSPHPVDFIPTGFTAGGVSACLGKDLDAYETKCMAMGDPYCEITVGTPERIKKERNQQWTKLKVK